MSEEREALLNGKKEHHNLAGLSVYRFRLVCISLWSAGFLVALDSTIVATLLSDIGSYFNSSNQASWLGTAYLLSLCCFTPIYGRLSDFIGRRNAHLTGLSFFLLGTLLCGVAPNMYTLIAARCIAGIGGGGVSSVGSIVMSDLVDLHHRGLYQGYVNIFYGLGAALGGPVGGVLSDNFGWRTAFLIQVPLLALAGFLVYTNVTIPARDIPTVPSRSGTSTPVNSSLRSSLARIDYLGSSTLVIAVSSLLISISLKTSSQKVDGTDYLWSDPLIWSLLVVSAVFTVIFILVEGYYVREPILPLGLLTRRTPIAVALSNLTMVINNFSILYNVPLYFTAVKLESSSVAGAHLLSYSIVVGLGSLVVGFIMRSTGRYYWCSIVSSGFIVLSSGLLTLWKQDSGEWLTWLAQVPAGFGYAGVLTSTLVALMTSVTREGKGETAVATSMTYMFRSTGQVLGVALSAALVQAVLVSDLKETITSPDAKEIISLIRHSTSSIKHLSPGPKAAAIAAYEHALHNVFIANLVLSIMTLLALTLVKEEVMPGREELKIVEEVVDA